MELGLPFSPLCDRKATMIAQSQIGKSNHRPTAGRRGVPLTGSRHWDYDRRLSVLINFGPTVTPAGGLKNGSQMSLTIVF